LSGFCSFSSQFVNKSQIKLIIIFKGFSVKNVFFQFIIFELAFAHSHCQSSSIGFKSICMLALESSSNFENAFVILFIGSDSSF
jgi:hypothetical protein